MRPGPAWNAYLAQARMELLLTTRRGENLLVTLIVPVALLVFLAQVPLLPAPAGAGARRIDELVPGILALAVISTGLVSLGIATAFERSSGVLKRLAGSPLPLWALVAAKATSVLATVALQLLLVTIAGWFLGWDPQGGVPGALLAAAPWLILGTLAFAGLGLLLAGSLRAETVLALANGLYLACLLVGGVIVPLDDLPAIVAAPASILPPALLADLLRAATAPGGTLVPLQAMALLAWAVTLIGLAARAFRVSDEG